MEKKIIVAKVLPKKSVLDFENVVENSHIWKKNRSHPVGLGGFQLKFVCISWVINHMTFVIILSALIGGFFLKSFTRFALKSECCNFNQ